MNLMILVEGIVVGVGVPLFDFLLPVEFQGGWADDQKGEEGFIQVR